MRREARNALHVLGRHIVRHRQLTQLHERPVLENGWNTRAGEPLESPVSEFGRHAWSRHVGRYRTDGTSRSWIIIIPRYATIVEAEGRHVRDETTMTHVEDAREGERAPAEVVAESHL